MAMDGNEANRRLAQYTDLALRRFTLDPQEVFIFLVTYGRFESSAKALGWVVDAKQDEPMWMCPKKVADAVEVPFQNLVEAEPSLLAAVRYFYENPPLRQVQGAYQAEWRKVPRAEKGMLRTLLDLAQARNNLFHGGKGWSEQDDRERDHLVVTHGLTILCAIISANAHLQEKFEAF